MTLLLYSVPTALILCDSVTLLSTFITIDNNNNNCDLLCAAENIASFPKLSRVTFQRKNTTNRKRHYVQSARNETRSLINAITSDYTCASYLPARCRQRSETNQRGWSSAPAAANVVRWTACWQRPEALLVHSADQCRRRQCTTLEHDLQHHSTSYLSDDQSLALR